MSEIRRLLIANRGEIARRIVRSAHAMGIGTVAVFADADAGAPFVSGADQAIALGGQSAAETYLNAGKVLAAAARAGADAIHPGYGFLSERADFAAAVLDAGLTWVGPPPEAIAAMGDKLAAKRAMDGAGVPTLPAIALPPGADPRAAAERIGFPALVKAAAGGGGRGMRVVHSAAGLPEAVESARREAQAAFGDGTVFLERWLEGARHVEIQILGDGHGNLVHCFERECSIQRRHQKVIEEAPSPAVDSGLRTRLGEAALAAARAVGYRSAGTVEFLLEGASFWFLEMNTRLQVEHPVTEEITGLDLVREQLRIAQGEPLGYRQGDLAISGHAIEARLYAEDPEQDFLPATGTVERWVPSDSVDARFDAGVESGSVVGIEFDPLLAKVIVHASTRREAALRLARALETTRVQGVTTNRDFLVATLRTDAFLAGRTTTDFIERVGPARRRWRSRAELEEAAILVALAAQHDRRRRSRRLSDVGSGWRNSVMPPESVRFRTEGEEIEVRYRAARDGAFGIDVGGVALQARLLERDGEAIVALLAGRRLAAQASAAGGGRWLVHYTGGDVELLELPRFPARGDAAVAGGLVAPMPGRVVSAHAAVGDVVEAGQLLLVLEAMKMEHRVVSPHAGTVSELRVRPGEQVANGALLVVLDAGGGAGGT